jgi:VanZ family protein
MATHLPFTPPPPRIGRWRPWASVFATAGIVALLMLPGSSVPSVGFKGIDALAHVLLFGTWAVIVQWELLAVAAGFALATELLQTVAIERSFSVADIAADLVGASLGGLLAAWLRRRSLQPGK